MADKVFDALSSKNIFKPKVLVKVWWTDMTWGLLDHQISFPKRAHTFFSTTIKPVFLYGGTVWSSTSKCNIRRIFRLQKGAPRVILGLKIERRTYCNPFQETGLATLL